MKPTTVAIVGAGLAGARAAETLRAEGFDGRVLLIGEEPLAPYERPALSKEFLAGTRDERSLLLRPPSFWNERGIELLLGRRVVAVDPVAGRLHTDSGVEHDFDALVLATGARPRRLPFPEASGVHELRTVADARALRERLAPGRRLVVIGGGFVGAEVASTAMSLGVRVTLVEASPAPLARVLGTRVGRLLAERWLAHGVDVRLGARVAGTRPGEVLLGDGERVGADVVLVGVGVEPALELLPTRPHARVLVAGDAAGSGHWTAAAHDGAAAARRVLDLPVPAPPLPYVWSDQFGLRLQIVGTPGPEDETELEGESESFAVRYRRPVGRLSAVLLVNRPAEVAAARRALLEDALALAA